MTVLLAACGLLVGFLAVTLGGGGGGLYVGLLTVAFHVPPAVAVSTSLATIVPTVLIGSFSHWHAGNLRLDVGWPVLLGGAVGAIIGSLLSPLIPAQLYIRALGALTLAMLLLVLLRAPVSGDGRSWRRALLGSGCGLAGGVLSGIAGISGSSPVTIGRRLDRRLPRAFARRRCRLAAGGLAVRRQGRRRIPGAVGARAPGQGDTGAGVQAADSRHQRGHGLHDAVCPSRTLSLRRQPDPLRGACRLPCACSADYGWGVTIEMATGRLVGQA